MDYTITICEEQRQLFANALTALARDGEQSEEFELLRGMIDQLPEAQNDFPKNDIRIHDFTL